MTDIRKVWIMTVPVPVLCTSHIPPGILHFEDLGDN